MGWRTLKRSVGLGKQKASISREKEFWKELNGIAGAGAWPCPAISAIRQHHSGDFASALPAFAFEIVGRGCLRRSQIAADHSQCARVL
jgi:predicted DNA-binding ribbon-helix-helix protein